MFYHNAIDKLLLTDKLNLKCYVLYETKELLTITKMYITIINTLTLIISIAIVIAIIVIIIIIIIIIIIVIIIIIIIISIIIITITVITIIIIIAFVKVAWRFVKSDNYLLQFLCHMTSDVKFSHKFFYLPFLSSKATTFYELK